MKKAMLCLMIIVALASMARADQTLAPCSSYWTLGPNDIPFEYDPNECQGQRIGYFAGVFAGQPTSCTINVCVATDLPVAITLLDAPDGMTYDPNTWTLSWQTDSNDVGLHYPKVVATIPSVPSIPPRFGTIPYQVVPDERPIFGPIIPFVSDY